MSCKNCGVGMNLKTGHLPESEHQFINPAASWSSLLGPLQLVIFAVLMASLLMPAGAQGSTRPISELCIDAAHQVSHESGIPVSVLLAITLTETGRNRSGTTQPWPWTVNMEGKGNWFDDRSRAQAYVETHYQRGARSFDIGCFQINYRWHGHAFSSFEEMFDPVANARYAASFLNELYLEFGDWSTAAGAYHSRTPEFSNRYRARFEAFRKRLNDPSAPRVHAASINPGTDRETAGSPHQSERPNLFPLLRSGNDRQGFGSLVPLHENPASGHRMIGGASRG